MDFISLSNLSFSYPSSSQILFDTVSLRIHRGWTAISGANGSGKTTLIKLIGGILSPSSGSISAPYSFYYCEQKTEGFPEGFMEFTGSYNNAAFKLKESLKIDDDWINRWNTLSQGERKRCQVAIALFLNPDILAIDEPSNHLDQESKTILFNSLKLYKGIGLLVSHDRKLLDELCSNTIFISNHKIEFRKSGFSAAAAERERENDSRLNKFNLLNKDLNKLRTKAVIQKQDADKADRNRSKKDIDLKDHDAKAKIDLARVTSKDALAGRLYRKTKTELERKNETLQSIEIIRKYPLGIEFNLTKINHYFPLTINSAAINLGNNKRLYIPDLAISAGDKIGITGSNGSGKSTFINHLVKLWKFSEKDLIYIPQEIDNHRVKQILNEINILSGENKGKIMSLVSRLNSDPKHILETEEPSPGEVRKLLLAKGLSYSPALIIMDEPTNHMDIPSMECIEQALNECKCPVLLVSHDSVFLNNIVKDFWNIEADEKGFIIKTAYNKPPSVY